MLYTAIKQHFIDSSSTDQCIKIFLKQGQYSLKQLILRPVILKDQAIWQAEKLLNNQIFHDNIETKSLDLFIRNSIEEHRFRQAIVTTVTTIYHYRLSKKEKILNYKEPNKQAKQPSFEHNRTKKYLLEEGMPILPLVDLGIFDGQFRLKAAAQKKFRQINHFLSLIVESIPLDNRSTLTMIDFGCGKSYLSFLVYYYFVFIKKINLTMIGYDLKADVVEHCNLTAQKYRYANLQFIHGDIANAGNKHGHVDAMITLHACNIATDYALYYGIKHRIPYIFSVPCCQHEINQQITPPQHLQFLFQHGLHKERLSALITDAIRCEILQSMGYSVDVVEFVEIENTPKNALIRAKLIRHTDTFIMSTSLQTFVDEFALSPTLIRLLQKENSLQNNR